MTFGFQHFGFQQFAAKLTAAQPFAKKILRSPSRSAWSKTAFAGFVLAAALTCVPAHAQSRRPRRESNANRKARIARNIEQTYTHQWEIGGGGGYLRFRPGANLQKNSEIAFWANGTYYLNQKLGITGEVRGGFGNAKIGNTVYNIPNPQISEYPFLAGPTYRFYRKEKYAISGFALGGAALGKFDGGSKGIPAANLGLWPSETRAAFSVGGNLDLNLYPNIAFRIAPSYLGTTFGGTLENNVGFEMGIVYRFGKQK